VGAEDQPAETGGSEIGPSETGLSAGPDPRTQALVETLMGRRPELRFDYIQKNARFVRDLDL